MHLISLVDLDKDRKLKMICDDIHKSSNIEYDLMCEIITHIADKIFYITKSLIFNFNDGEKEVQSYHCMDVADIELLMNVKSADNFIIYDVNYYDDHSFILSGFFYNKC